MASADVSGQSPKVKAEGVCFPPCGGQKKKKYSLSKEEKSCYMEVEWVPPKGKEGFIKEERTYLPQTTRGKDDRFLSEGLPHRNWGLTSQYLSEGEKAIREKKRRSGKNGIVKAGAHTGGQNGPNQSKGGRQKKAANNPRCGGVMGIDEVTRNLHRTTGGSNGREGVPDFQHPNPQTQRESTTKRGCGDFQPRRRTLA